MSTFSPIKYKKFTIGKYEIIIEERSRDNFWGRFGGGWNWKLGFQCEGGTSIIKMPIKYYSQLTKLREGDKEEGMKSDCHEAEIVMQYKVLKDGYSLGKGYKVCSRCHKPCKSKKEGKK